MKGGRDKKRQNGGKKPAGPGKQRFNKGKPGVTKNAGKPQQLAGKKRKAPAQDVQNQVAPEAGAASGDVDDFVHMLDEMEDYRPADDAGPDAQSDLETDPAADGNDGGQQAQRQSDVGAGNAGEAAAEGGKKAKKRRKRGQKLSSLEFEASRRMAQQVAEAPAEEQADWLWAKYQQAAAATALERGGLNAEGMAELPAQGSLEGRLKALVPAGGWQRAFCSRDAGQPAGSPVLLLVSASAMGAVALIKLLPAFNRACKVGKLFAKHFKVEEQEEVLRSQVMCVAAGTPNRLCKLADGGALRLDRLRHVVLDAALDVKQRDILAIPETARDFWELYGRHLKPLVDSGSLKLSLVNSDRLG